MYRIILSLFAVLLITACSEPKTELQSVQNIKGSAVYGDSITQGSILDLSAIKTDMQNEDRKEMKLKGLVHEVCQEKGCWITMKSGNEDPVKITFKDYKIFLPKDLKGREVVLDGYAYIDTVTVEEQRHHAKDAGRSEAEIAKISSPKTQIAFEASGVVVDPVIK